MFCISNRTVLAASALLLSGCARHYRAAGTVIDVNTASQTVTISHRAIPGYMPAMAMPFPVAHPAELAAVQPGTRVNFDLAVRKQGARITKLRVEQSAPADFPVPKPAHAVAIGEVVPDFTLVDEQGRPSRLSDFRGHLTALQFIYTRCPLPDVCPRLSANFAYLQRKFGRDVALLSITIDPEHDTPAVLRDYAHRWRADPSVWHFLTGPPAEVRRVAENFGLFYFAEEGSITHTSSVAVITPGGRLCATLTGSSYTAQELADLVGGKIARRSQP